MFNFAGLASGARKPGLKALLVAFLVTLMFIPVTFVTALIEERMERAERVTEEVGRIWGGRDQTIAGPFLVVPYDAGTPGKPERHYAVILPEDLSVDADIRTETRYRGIFRVPVYETLISVSGHFDMSEARAYVKDAAHIRTEQAFLVVNISDPRGLRSNITLSWGEAAHAFRPESRFNVFGQGGIHAVLPSPVLNGGHETAGPAGEPDGPAGAIAPAAAPDTVSEKSVPFAFDMTLNGSRTLKFLPVGRSTAISLKADWPSPSFSGGFLPTEHEVGPGEFTARWRIPDLARNFPQSWRLGQKPDMAPALIGVDLHEGVDFYQKIARSTKYAILFFGFTFLAFFLTEVVSSARIHPVQYLMTGAAQIVFYLLLLSIAEHVGFDKAYGVASAATILLVTIYGGSAVRSVVFALILFVVLVAVYALLYSLLQAGDFALLFGSVAAFLGLAITMLLTRRVDWYGLTGAESS